MPTRQGGGFRKRPITHIGCAGDPAPEVCLDADGCLAVISNITKDGEDYYLLATTGTIGGYVRAVVETIGTETTPWQPLGDPIELTQFPFIDGFTITLEVSNDVEEEKYVCSSVTVTVQEYTDEEFEGGEETYNLDSIFTLPACTGTETFTVFETDADDTTITGTSITITDNEPESQTVLLHKCNGAVQAILVLNTVEAAEPELGLRLTYTPGNLPANNLAAWNTFFNLPANGTAFTAMSNTGDEVTLYGGAGITLKQSLFRTSATLLKIEDDINCVTAIAGGKNAGALSLCSALTTVTLNGVLTVAQEGLFTNAALVNISLGACTTLGQSAFGSNASVITYNLPAVTTADQQCFRDCTSATTFTLPLLTSAGAECFMNCAAATTFTLPELLTAGNATFRSCTSNVTFNIPKLTTTGIDCFKDCTSATTFTLPLCTTIGDACFVSCTAATTFNLSACTALGISTGDNGVFVGITGNTVTITVPIALKTCDTGSPDGDLVTLAANNPATINYI